jgi:hypothetical protein
MKYPGWGAAHPPNALSGTNAGPLLMHDFR